MFPEMIEIDVTNEDIIHGVKGKCEKCAVSHAINRQYPDMVVKTAGPYVKLCLTNHDDKGRKYFPQNDKDQKQLIDFITSYDNDEIVKPFKMTIIKGNY